MGALLTEGALFGPGGEERSLYRYQLTRRVGQGERRIAFWMLNPSTAGALRPDPTLRSCARLAVANGFGWLHLVNRFAYRSPHPRELARRSVVDAEGPENIDHVRWVITKADLVVCAWGVAPPALSGRGVLPCCFAGLPPLWCLGRTNSGHPRHPLFVASTTQLVPFKA